MNDGILMRNLLKKMRLVNENLSVDKGMHIETTYDQKREEQKFNDYLRTLNFNVTVDSFEKLEIVPNKYVFWGGTIDNMIQFVFIVTNNEKTSKVEFNYSNEFNKDNEDNTQLIDKIQEYYNIFYKYWSKNNFNVDTQ